ncbi:unnamed protein product [Lymnaea stagnalis]|uniref:Uncharacterized protein n=1 Tax=Lymnaea stagnalis TaxID=6523 RepID=A0AAV2HGU3_LYMST
MNILLSLVLLCCMLMSVQAVGGDYVNDQWLTTKIETHYWDSLDIKTLVCAAQPERKVEILYKRSSKSIEKFAIANGDQNDCQLSTSINNNSRVACWRSSDGDVYFKVVRISPEDLYICQIDDDHEVILISVKDPDVNTAPSTNLTSPSTATPTAPPNTPRTTTKGVDAEQAAAVVAYQAATIALAAIPGVIGIVTVVKAALWISANGLPKCSAECVMQCLGWLSCFRKRVVINIELNTDKQQEDVNKAKDRTVDVDAVESINEILETYNF